MEALTGYQKGRLEFDGKIVSIIRKRDELRIDIRSISSISIERLGPGLSGVRFSTAGARTTHAFTGGMIQSSDPSLFRFKTKDLESFRQMVHLIEDNMALGD